MSIVFFLAIIGLGAAVYYGIQRFGGAAKAERAGLENPANPSKAKTSNPLQKYVEVVGIRLIQEKKKPAARFVIVNHSNTELNDLSANVTVWASTARSEEDAVGTFTFKIPTLGPNEAKEMTSAFKTKLKVYEMPDWQNATAEIQITTP